MLVGSDVAWTATYAAWIDELEGVFDGPPEAVMATVSDTVVVRGEREHELRRSYGVFANDELYRRLRGGVEHLDGVVDSIVATAGSSRHEVRLADGVRLRARLVVDASGWPSRFGGRPRGPAAWQTAFGVVVAEPPPGPLGRPTLMDLRPVESADGRPSSVGPAGVATFCYAAPVQDGWLVEETVLAARRAVEPVALLPRLAARLGRTSDGLLADAVRVEYVRIPMGTGLPERRSPLVAFGAAAGYVHPATGFSVTASLCAAGPVAEAICEALVAGNATGAVDPTGVTAAVWPRSARRARQLHRYGLEVLLDLGPDEIGAFFDTFFDLPTPRWAPYLRIDAPPAAIVATMAAVFRAASWPLRRRLLSADPRRLVRSLRS